LFAGYGEQKLFWNDGSFRFSYTGQKCNSTHNYTLTVLLMCDYDTNSHNNLGVFHHGDSCDIVSVMHTSSACLPKSETYKNTKCFLKNGAGQILNFESLRNTNHRIERPDGKEFIISICDPVLYNHESACEAGSSVCLFDSKAEGTERYKNIGTMNQDFQLNGKLVELKLKSKEKCSRTGLNYESIIIFECDKLAENGYPSFSHFNEDICQYVFQWPTAAACVEKSSCHATNPDTGLSYDFSQLSGVQFEASISNKTDKKIVFSICSEAKDPCMKNTGSCLVKTKNNQSTQAGIVNNELKIDGKNPYLLYESGAICEKIGQNYKTRIDFICADNLHDEGATVIEDGCNIVIQYRTLLACGYLKNCIAKKLNGEEIDLSPLIDFDGNYEAKVNSKTLPKEASDEIKYVLNICRPLNSFYSLNCRGTSGACRTVLDKKTGKHEKEMTLGHPEYIMTATKDDKVIMKYLDGASCEEEKDENVTTKITFYCDEKAGLGNPILQSIEFCEYSFDFATNLLCKDQLVSMVNDSSCNLVNNKNSVSIDLKLFGDNGTFIVDGDKINICGGDNKFYTIVYSHSLVRIEFAMNHGNGEIPLVAFYKKEIHLIDIRFNSLDKIDVEVQIKCSADNSTAIVNDVSVGIGWDPFC
jgi:insulin-like growth factor 2 receptor